MRPGQFSRTAIGACALRAAHRRVDRPLLFDDPLAARILRPRELVSARWPRAAYRLESLGPRTLLLARGHVIGRARYAEDALVAAHHEWGGAQYLILGAGLDTFAWRRPPALAAVPVIEVDHPATQAEKRRRTASWAAAGMTAGPQEFLSVDFTREELAPALRRGLSDTAMGTVRDGADGAAAARSPRVAPVFVSWLGVTPYLPRAAVAKTLRTLAMVLPPGSRLVLDFAEDFRRGITPGRDIFGAGLLWAAVRLLGERFHNHGLRADALPGFWRDHGWHTRELLTTEAVNSRIFASAGSALRMIPTAGLALLERA
ncbi:MAG: class I SAM-dependent methyltransferase [Oceanococcaceae bacterium]